MINNDLNFRPTIENAHRRGARREDGSPRPILAKFLYRPQLVAVIKMKKDLKNDVRISEDLIWEDREKKKQLRTVMKEAYVMKETDLGFTMVNYILMAICTNLDSIFSTVCKRLKCK